MVWLGGWEAGGEWRGWCGEVQWLSEAEEEESEEGSEKEEGTTPEAALKKASLTDSGTGGEQGRREEG